MPIVDIEIVLKPDEAIADEMVSELADQLGKIFNSPKNGPWVKVHEIAGHHYAENEGKEQGVYPIFVSLLDRDYQTGKKCKRKSTRSQLRLHSSVTDLPVLFT